LDIELENGIAKIKVHQVVNDLNGQLIADEIVHHYFHLVEDKISVFEIGDKVTN
jgi:hypothetical protein